MRRNPWGKVPSVAFPNGYTLYESRVICAYLTKKYNFPLLPPAADLEATATFDQEQQVETLYFAEPAGRLMFEKFVKKFLRLPANDAVVAQALESLEALFNVAERTLQRQNYMAGDNFTLVDIYYIPLIRRLFVVGHGELVSSRAAVSGWWKRCMERPAISKMFEADEKARAASSQ